METEKIEQKKRTISADERWKIIFDDWRCPECNCNLKIINRVASCPRCNEVKAKFNN